MHVETEVPELETDTIAEEYPETPDNLNGHGFGKHLGRSIYAVTGPPVGPNTRDSVHQPNPTSTACNAITLLHIRDTLSGDVFLVDTGAKVSIVPPTGPDLRRPPGLHLVAANGTRIQSFGTR